MLLASESAVPKSLSTTDLVSGSSTLLSGSSAPPGSLVPAEKAISPDMSARLRIRELIDVRVRRREIDMSILIFLNVEVTWQMR